MDRKVVKVFIMFLVFFSFSYSQKVITNRTLMKYHHNKKKKTTSQEKVQKNKNTPKEGRSTLYDKSSIFKDTKDPKGSALAKKIIDEMNRLEYLKRKFLDQYNIWWKTDRKIEKMKMNGENVPSWLLDKRKKEKESLDRIRNEENDLEAQIAKDLKKAAEMGDFKK